MEQDNRESNYAYIADMDDEIMEEVVSMVNGAIKNFNIPQTTDGRELAKKINEIVDHILESGEYPDEYEDIQDVSVALGCLYGHALVIGYGWEWKAVGKNAENATYCVVSPDRNWMTPFMNYINKILTGVNYGVDGENDNTCLLLYNMIEKTMQTVPEKKLNVLC